MTRYFEFANSKLSNGKTTFEAGIRKHGRAKHASTDAISCQAEEGGGGGGEVYFFGEISQSHEFVSKTSKFTRGIQGHLLW